MASADPVAAADSDKEAPLTTARAFVFLFDKANGQWSPVGDRTICKLRLLIGGGSYKLIGTNEVSEARVLDLPLSNTSSYRPIEDTFYQLTVTNRELGFDRLYGLKFSSVQDAKFFSVVLERTLSSVASSQFQPPSEPSSLGSNASSNSWSRSVSLGFGKGSSDLQARSGGFQLESSGVSQRYTSLPGSRSTPGSSVDSGHFSGVSSIDQSLSSLSVGGEDTSEQMAHAHRSSSGLPKTQIEQLARRLAHSIESGDRQRAATLAEMLASERVAVSVTVEQQNEVILEPMKETDEISLIVQVEDREFSGPELKVKVRPTMTVLELKAKFWRDFDFPVEVQRWIMEKRFMEDEQTLDSYGINVPNARVYLYLLSAKTAGIRQTREEYQESHGHHDRTEEFGQRNQLPRSPKPSYESENPLPPNILTNQYEPSGLPHPNVLPSPQEQPVHAPQRPGGMFHWRPPGPTKPVVPPSGAAYQHDQFEQPAVKTDLGDTSDPHPFGWRCPDCTLINEPTRPGCAVCGSARPEDYRVPDNVPLSNQERARLAKVARDERLVLEQEQRLIEGPRDLSN